MINDKPSTMNGGEIIFLQCQLLRLLLEVLWASDVARDAMAEGVQENRWTIYALLQAARIDELRDQCRKLARQPTKVLNCDRETLG